MAHCLVEAPFTVNDRLSGPFGRVKLIDRVQPLSTTAQAMSRTSTFMQPLTLELSGGAAVRLDDGLGVRATILADATYDC